MSECRKAGGVVCQLWLGGGVRGRHRALPTPPLLHWSTTTWRSNVHQGGRRAHGAAGEQPAGEDWFCGLPCCPGPARCIVLCGALTLPVLCGAFALLCTRPGAVVVVVVVVHLDSRNVRNRVTVLHVLPPTSRVAQIFLAMNSNRGSVCDRCACPDLAYGIIGQVRSLPAHQQHGSGQESR